MADIQAVIFDYGAVLCHPPTDADYRDLASCAGVELAALRKLYGANRGPYDQGLVNTAEYWERFGRAMGREFEGALADRLAAIDRRMWSRLDQRMIRLAARVRAAGLRTMILSNMQHDMLNFLREDGAWMDHFDAHVFSCEARLIKPDPAIYDRAISAAGVPAESCFFIDDSAANIEAARAAGIVGWLYQSFEALESRLAPVIGNRREAAVVTTTAHRL